MVTLGEWSNNNLLDSYKEDYLLVDTIFDIINNVSKIYTPNSHPRPQTPEILSLPLPPSTSPLQERPSEYAAATPPPLTLTDTPT